MYDLLKRWIAPALSMAASVTVVLGVSTAAFAHEGDFGLRHDWHAGPHFGSHAGCHWSPFAGYHCGPHFGLHARPHHNWYYGGGFHRDHSWDEGD